MPIPGAAKFGKFVGKSFVYSAEFIAKNPGVLGKGFARTMRKTAGKVTGGESLKYIKESDVWLRGTDGNAGKIPKQVADKLRGREFKSFDQFRQAFWKEVANNPVLSKSFTVDDLAAMKLKGTAPTTAIDQQVGKIKGYEIHHINPIHNSGGVYDVDNLWIVTPRYHKEVLYPKFHYNKQK